MIDESDYRLPRKPQPEQNNKKKKKGRPGNAHLSGEPSVATVRHGMVTLKRDRKAKDCWLVTTTDKEGFHRQLPITFDDMPDKRCSQFEQE